MSRLALWTFTAASALLWVVAGLLGLLEVWHLAHGVTEHFAGTFAVQLAVIASVFTVAAAVAARGGQGVATSTT